MAFFLKIDVMLNCFFINSSNLTTFSTTFSLKKLKNPNIGSRFGRGRSFVPTASTKPVRTKDVRTNVPSPPFLSCSSQLCILISRKRERKALAEITIFSQDKKTVEGLEKLVMLQIDGNQLTERKRLLQLRLEKKKKKNRLILFFCEK
jgi:hypothetical protein